MERVIWNGVGLDVPPAWEPAAVERDGLIFEHEDRPVCELKFRHVRGAFSFDKHIRRLTKSHKGVDVRTVSDSEAPEAWIAAVDALAQSGLRHQSFMWRTPEDKGIGAALFNPATGLAALVQYFVRSDADETAAAESLAAFRDRTGGKTAPFRLFGLEGRVPDGFMLHTFSFKPGHYSISYWRPKSKRHVGRVPSGKGPGTSLVFQRVAPASVLLKETSLVDYVRTMDQAPPENMHIEAEPDRVMWSDRAHTSQLLTFFGKEKHHCGAAWIADPGNAILAVTVAGKVPMDQKAFIAAVESYALVS